MAMAFLFSWRRLTERLPSRPRLHQPSNWRPGDEIPLGPRSLRVVRIRDDDADQPPVLVVEDVAG